MTQTMLSDTAVKNVRKNVPLHYSRCLRGSSANISTAVVCTCMHLLGMPAVLLSVILYLSDKLQKGTVEHYFSEFDGSVPYIVIGCIAFIIAFLAGSNAAMNSFTHLYSKQKVDMELSLPLSYKQRFVSGYFTGLGTYILPFIAAQAVSMILFLIGHLTLDGKTIKISGQIRGVTFSAFETLFPYYIEAAAGVLVIMIMFYTMWVLTMTFCGSKLEAVLYGTGANLIMPAIFGSVILIIDSTLYGSSADSYIALGDTFLGFLISCTSPAGAAFALAQYLANKTDTSQSFFGYYLTEESNLNFARFIVSVLAVSAVFFFAAMFVYSRRKAEDTGKSFAVKGFYYFVLSCMIFFIITVTMYNTLDLVPVIIVSAAAYIILDCICERGVKRIGLSCVKYIVTTLVCLGVFFLPSKTGCFGVEYRVPDVSEISSVTLVGYYDYFRPSLYYGIYTGTGEESYSYYDEENIKMITDMHRAHLEYYKEHPELKSALPSRYGYSYQHFSDSILPLSDAAFSIKYKLKNGFTLTRNYKLYCGALEKIINLDTSAEAKENYIAGITEAIEKIREEYDDSLNAYTSGRFHYGIPHQEFKMPQDFCERLTECLAEDIRNVSFEEYIHPERPSYNTLFIQGKTVSGTVDGRYIQIELPAYYHKTAEYLNSVGLDPGETDPDIISGSVTADTAEICISRFDSSFHSPVNTSSLNEKIISFVPDEQFTNYDINDRDTDGVYVLTRLLDDEDINALCEIYSNSIEYCVPETDCYTVKRHGTAYCYIPEQYNSTIERIYEKYKDYGFRISPETGEIEYMTE